MENKHSRSIVSFFVITFAFSWILWLPFVLAGLGVFAFTETMEGLVMIVVILGAFGPLVSALILLRKIEGKYAIKKYFKEIFNFKIKPIFYALAILVPLLITLIAHYFTNLTGIDTLPNNLFPEGLGFSPWLLVVPYLILMLTFGGGQEEFGWRGYVQKPLQNKFGILLGSMILGFMWGLWHLPLWFIPNEGHEFYSFFAFILFTISFSVIMGIIYNASGKKMVVPWMMHAVSNTAIPLFPVVFLASVPQPGYWIFVSTNILVAIGLAVGYHNKINLIKPTIELQ